MLEGCQSVIKFYISVCGLSYPIEIISIIHNGKVILNLKCFGFTGNSGWTLEMHYRSKAFIIRLVTRLKRLSVKIHELRFNTDSDKHAAFEYLWIASSHWGQTPTRGLCWRFWCVTQESGSLWWWWWSWWCLWWVAPGWSRQKAHLAATHVSVSVWFN